jgi:hypothetical protein
MIYATDLCDAQTLQFSLKDQLGFMPLAVIINRCAIVVVVNHFFQLELIVLDSAASSTLETARQNGHLGAHQRHRT